MEELQFTVERITFRNNTNGYSVIKGKIKNEEDLVAAVGIMPSVHVGGIFKLYGYWKNDPKWGIQFMFNECQEILPTTTHGIEKYLGSGLIKGIGQTYAKKIVDYFGDRTMEILELDIDKLSEIPGIGTKRLEMIKQSWLEQNTIKNIMIFLQGYDVSTSLATKIFKHYGDKSIETVKANPYKLADEIWGVGFKTADSIASKLGFDKNHYERIRSGIIYTLNQQTESGHCFLYLNELIDKTREILDVKDNLIINALDIMNLNSDIIRENDSIYLPMYYYSETGTADKLLNLLRSKRNINIYFDDYDIEISRNAFTDKYITYDETQLQAIKEAIRNKILVLTGGPGTGKTTTTQGIIDVYRRSGAKILLAAPTGRAAKRMSEVTGMEAKTIHRMLEMKPGEGFGRDEDNPLKGDVLIIDESSMIDILLMYSLLKAVPDNMTLILVGDVDQLPSVGAGKVLSDILQSNVIPYIKLNKIFRQAQRSKIITNAHKINKGEFPYVRDDRSDFKFVDCDDPEQAANLIIDICVNNHISQNDIQVLTPMKKGAIGTTNLNLMLQAALNPLQPGSKSINRFGIDYRARDKVMQIRNNYEKNIFNGDIGFIAKIDDDAGGLTVEFDGRLIHYERDELDELVLAYASTIHKSQGSEFPYVVIPIMMSHFIMLQRNLLYTGVTRAKKGLVLVGQTKAIYCAVKNDKIVKRNTKLAQRLTGDI